MEYIFELLIIFFAASGLALHSRVGGFFSGSRRKHQFIYYTSLSNLLVLIYFVARLAPPFRSFLKTPSVWFSIVMTIGTTLLIYHFLIRKSLKKRFEQSGETGLKFFSHSNLSVHYFTPILTFLDWALFADKESLKYFAGLEWTLIPLAYTAFTFLRGIKGGNLELTESPYPYGFIDPLLIGWKKTALNILIISVVMILWGLFIIWIFKYI
jgi:hypothetical protein